MQLRPPFHFPTRVSRLYPIFSLILVLNSSVLFYVWQMDRIKLASYENYDSREQSLHDQISALQASQKEDHAQLDLQNQKVSEATAKLTAVQKELDAKNDQLTQAQAQLKNQQSQLAQNAADLAKLRSRPPLFSFQNNSSRASVTTDIADAKEVVNSAYDYVQQLYGQPYLLNSIVITFVDSFTISGSSGEIVIKNDQNGITINIRLKDFNKTNFEDINTLIHEIIHGFHGVAVFDSSAIEEGMTVAATDAVMQKMINDGKLPSFPHLYITATASQYESWNKSLSVSASNTAFYTNPQVAQVYQMIGYAWYQLYKQDSQVFKKINEAYYQKVQKGIPPDTGVALDAIRSSISNVNGVPITNFLADNRAFNPS